MEPLDPIKEEIQDALRKARVLRARGDESGASALMEEAIRKYPEHPDAMEAHADGLRDRGEITEARDLYGEIIAKCPGRIATERKHAELVLRIAEKDFAAQQAFSEIDMRSLMNPAGVKRRAGTASFFSLLAPGFGQIYNGELVKGLLMFALAALFWFLMFTIGYVGSGGRGEMTATGWVLAALGLAFYITSVLDAGLSAGRSAPPPAPERPRPPVDKPFE